MNENVNIPGLYGYDDEVDEQELLDAFYYHPNNVIPNGGHSTQLQGITSNPPVSKITHHRSTSPAKLSRQKLYNNKFKSYKPETKNLLLKDYLRIILSILAAVLLLTSISILILSILATSTINSAFAPALNIIQTQIICGFGIFTGAILGMMQIKHYCTNKLDDIDVNCIHDHGI